MKEFIDAPISVQNKEPCHTNSKTVNDAGTGLDDGGSGFAGHS
jgi:hypothetical protein